MQMSLILANRLILQRFASLVKYQEDSLQGSSPDLVGESIFLPLHSSKVFFYENDWSPKIKQPECLPASIHAERPKYRRQSCYYIL